MSSKKSPLIIPFYINHSGCPQQCVFCNQHRISGSKGGFPDKETIVSTVRDYLASWKGSGQREVAFYGGSFTAIGRKVQAALLDALAPFIEKGQIDSIRISTRPDFIDPDILGFLKARGVSTIELGIQSMDDEVLLAAGRGHSAGDSIRACELVKLEGFKLGCQLMPGLPRDSSEISIDGAHQVAGLMPDFVRIYPTLVIEGTELAGLYSEGAFVPVSLDAAVELCADMVEIFREKGIEVIRVGLQAEASLEASVIAGPYHPAFGEMVESAIFLKKVRSQVDSIGENGKGLTLAVSPRDESALRGQKNRNMKRLEEIYPSMKFNVLKREDVGRRQLLAY